MGDFPQRLESVLDINYISRLTCRDAECHVHKRYSEGLKFQIIIWKGLPPRPSRLKHASRILSRLVLGFAGLLASSKNITTKMFSVPYRQGKSSNGIFKA
jgi:hypothetical protein